MDTQTQSTSRDIPSRPSPPRSWWKTALLGCLLSSLAVTCGVGSCLGLAGGGACWAWQELEEPARRTDAFLTALEEGDTSAAYELMSPGYRKHNPPSNFANMIEPSLPTIRGAEHRLGGRQIDNREARIRATVLGSHGDAACTIQLERDSGDWFVTGFQLQTEQAL